jgi:hypothetical protein
VLGLNGEIDGNPFSMWLVETGTAPDKRGPKAYLTAIERGGDRRVFVIPLWTPRSQRTSIYLTGQTANHWINVVLNKRKAENPPDAIIYWALKPRGDPLPPSSTSHSLAPPHRFRHHQPAPPAYFHDMPNEPPPKATEQAQPPADVPPPVLEEGPV